MDKKLSSDLPENDKARFEAAINRTLAEVDRVKKRMTKESPGVNPRQPATVAYHVLEGKAKEFAHRAKPVDADLRGEGVDVLREILVETRHGGVMNRRHLVLAVFAALIAALGIIINSNRNTQTVVGQLERNKLAITDPPDGASVGLGQRVRGITPYSDRNHYLAVTTIRTGSTRVQPVFVSPDGALSGDARFNGGGGDPSVGEDDEFTIRVLATKSTLEPGNLANTPDDAIFSKPITVRRTKPAEQIVINAPADRSEVGLDGAITGKTSLPDLNHYIVVKSLKVGTSYVQDRPALINRNERTFTGNARFGSGAVGIGEQYVIRVLATKLTLQAAPLTNEPTDAVFSNSVTVTRKQ